MSRTNLSTPTIITGEIQHEVLTRFRNIDSNDLGYLNKTRKAIDELLSFVYQEADANQVGRGDTEDIATTFEKEREAGLEYQDDALYQRSTQSDYDNLAVSPHTNTITKLLELRPLDREDLFAKMYMKFVTESILYNVAMGYADDVIKLEYGEISAYLTVKELLILFLYCEGQLHGFFTKTDENGTVNRDVKIPTSVCLTVPYKKSFPEIPEYYNWRNMELYSPYVLMIIPDELTLKSEYVKKWNDRTGEYDYSKILPSEAEGKYILTNADEDRSKWKWVSDSGSTIAYDITDSGVGRWVFSFVTGSGVTSGKIVTYSEVKIPYWNWLCWHPNLVYNDETGADISAIDADIQVTKFHYAMDDMMPNYETYSYIDFDYPDGSLVHLIDKQATAYVSMWKEYMLSGLSRQHAAFLQVMDNRTFRGVVKLNLSPYETFKEHIQNSQELTDILAGLDVLNEVTRAEEYKYLSDTIIKLLYPIESKYLIDSSLSMGGKLNKIKDLVIDLCSYNVAWVADPNAFGNSIIDCFGNNTLDVIKSVYGMQDISRITETKSYLGFGVGLTDRWCYDEIYTKKYVVDTDTGVLSLIDEPTCHDCIDHQYIITASVTEHIPTIIADIETGENDGAIGHGFTTILNLADSDYPKPSDRFKDSTFASSLEYNSDYNYCPPTWGVGINTKLQKLKR